MNHTEHPKVLSPQDHNDQTRDDFREPIHVYQKAGFGKRKRSPAHQAMRRTCVSGCAVYLSLTDGRRLSRSSGAGLDFSSGAAPHVGSDLPSPSEYCRRCCLDEICFRRSCCVRGCSCLSSCRYSFHYTADVNWVCCVLRISYRVSLDQIGTHDSHCHCRTERADCLCLRRFLSRNCEPRSICENGSCTLLGGRNQLCPVR